MLLKSLRIYLHKLILPVAILFAYSDMAIGQNLIGYNEQYIINYMKDNHSEMSYNGVTNNKFNYLKYSDSSDNQTILFFLDNKSVCSSMRMVCNYSIKNAKINEFNSIYESKDRYKWINNRDGKKYLIEMKDETWNCIVTIEPDK